MIITDKGCEVEAQLTQELLNVIVNQQSVRKCTKIACDIRMSKIAFHRAPPNGRLLVVTRAQLFVAHTVQTS